ncbi:uncharacterized protein [Anas platyrhynchos]|uniref:uncharacterized protein n=1 Tax=Anas platyrhynchos TaxID=8839 RepID=UPI003AF30877
MRNRDLEQPELGVGKRGDVPLAICRLLTEGKGRLEGEQGLQRGRACKPAAGCTLLAHGRCTHTARVAAAGGSLRAPCAPDARGSTRSPLARLLGALARPLGALARPPGALAQPLGALARPAASARRSGHAAPRRLLARPPCAPATGSLHSPEAILGAAAGPAQDGGRGAARKGPGVPVPRPTAPRSPQISPGPVQSSAPSTRLQPSPRAHMGIPVHPTGGERSKPRGAAVLCPPPGSPPAPGHPSAHRGDPVGDRVLAVRRGRAGRRAQRCAHLFRFTERIKKNSKNEIIGEAGEPRRSPSTAAVPPPPPPSPSPGLNPSRAPSRWPRCSGASAGAGWGSPRPQPPRQQTRGWRPRGRAGAPPEAPPVLWPGPAPATPG